MLHIERLLLVSLTYSDNKVKKMEKRQEREDLGLTSFMPQGRF